MVNDTNLGKQVIRTARYFNSNYHACAIVAVISTGIDWAAYMNGCDASIPEAECVAFVADMGAKLSAHDARHFFPNIDLPYRG